MTHGFVITHLYTWVEIGLMIQKHSWSFHKQTPSGNRRSVCNWSWLLTWMMLVKCHQRLWDWWLLQNRSLLHPLNIVKYMWKQQLSTYPWTLNFEVTSEAVSVITILSCYLPLPKSYTCKHEISSNFKSVKHNPFVPFLLLLYYF